MAGTSNLDSPYVAIDPGGKAWDSSQPPCKTVTMEIIIFPYILHILSHTIPHSDSLTNGFDLQKNTTPTIV